MFGSKIEICYKFIIFFTVIITLVSCGRNDSNVPLGGDNNQTQTETTNNTVDQNLTTSSYFDPVIYGFHANDSIEESSEDLLVAARSFSHESQKLNYKVSIGHLVTEDANLLIPNARISFISYSSTEAISENRPITFIFNGGPGLSSLNILFNSFSPLNVSAVNSILDSGNPYILTDNPESLIAKTDLVYMNPIGTGLSVAISPFQNKDFWGVDNDAKVIAKFIQRYLIKFNKQKSPIYLMGDSYGSVRCVVTAEMLMQDSLFIDGIILMSSIFDYSKWQNSEGVIPTLAANAWFHKKMFKSHEDGLNDVFEKTVHIVENSYKPFMEKWRSDYKIFKELLFNNKDAETNKIIKDYLKKYTSYNEVICALANGNFYQVALSKTLHELLIKLKPMPYEIAQNLAQYTALDANVIQSQTQLVFNKEPFADLVNYAMISLLSQEGIALGIYDGRQKDFFSRITVDDKLNLDKDPNMQELQKTNYELWNKYTNFDLNYYAASAFRNYNSLISVYWDYWHKSLTGSITEGIDNLNIANDLIEILKQNPELRIFQASGLYDAVTPYYQILLDLENITKNEKFNKKITIKNYAAGHFIYLDNITRILLKSDLEKFYSSGIGL